MYEAYFGFSQRPFAAAPVANRYFPAASVDAARQTLARCVERGAGAGLLIGPPGMGKSLLLQVLAAQFADKMAVVQLAGGQLASRRELLQAILFELHLPYRGLEEGEMRLALVDHLTRGDKCPQGMLLVVDEAQTLAKPLLEELRMMTNLARAGETRVRLVLAGSMELEEAFASPDLQAFSQRLAGRCYLEPFDRAETLDYLRFQMAVAGGQAERVFDAAAMDAVHRATDGIPRLINQLCDHALLLAYQAEERPLRAKAIDVAWADLQQLPSPWQHEHAADDQAGASAETIEFGALDDDEPAPTGASNRASQARTERVEVDFSDDWAEDELPVNATGQGSVPARQAIAIARAERNPPPARTAAPPAKAKGLRIAEDTENLQIVVDPYQMLDEDDEEEEATHAPATNPTAGQVQSVREAPAVEASAVAPPVDHEMSMLWEDVIIPSQPAAWGAAPRPLEQPAPRGASTPRRAPASSSTAVPVHHANAEPRASSGSIGALEEEVVADRYAELDARRPKPIEPAIRPAGPSKPSLKRDAARQPHDARRTDAARAATYPAPVNSDGGPGLDERVTLAEAMRLRLEAEAAAAMARVLTEAALDPTDEHLRLTIDQVPALPSSEDWLAASETMVLDPTQMPPGAVADTNRRDLKSDIIIIDDEPPASLPNAAEPVHRVERKDYKSLLARLRNG